jgi:uncharacterized protein
MNRLLVTLTAWVCRHPRSILIAFGLATLLSVVVALNRLGVESSEDALFRSNLSFVQARNEFKRSFPELYDPILVLIEGDDASSRRNASRRMEAEIRRDASTFRSVYNPIRFFESRGLLYLDPPQLETLLAEVQSSSVAIQLLHKDPSLRGVLSTLSFMLLGASEDPTLLKRIEPFLKAVTRIAEQSVTGSPEPMTWEEWLSPEGEGRDHPEILLVQATLDSSALSPAEHAIARLRQITQTIHAEQPNLRIRLTGVLPLAADEAAHIEKQAGWAGLGSFVLVGLILLYGLRSFAAILRVLLVLVVGLALTAAFASLAVGHLNLISVSFGVLFIGLSVDFSIHLYFDVIRRRQTGEAMATALVGSAADIGPSMFFCAATTAAAFYACVPSDFLGISELGLIAGTGMLISLLANFTLFPALLMLDRSPVPASRPPSRWLTQLQTWPVRHRSWAIGGTVALCLVATLALPKVRFDSNPLNVRDPSTESVQAFQTLLEKGLAFPWNLSAFATSDIEAQRKKHALEALPEVDHAVVLEDYLPQAEAEKLRKIKEVGGPLLEALRREPRRPAPSLPDSLEAIQRLKRSLGLLSITGSGLANHPDIEALTAGLSTITSEASASNFGPLDQMSNALVGTLPEVLDQLETQLSVQSVNPMDLPTDLVQSYRRPNGQRRIEIFPAEDLGDIDRLGAYVKAVQTVDPDVFGEGWVILESGRAVVDSFRGSFLRAAFLVALLIFLAWRSIKKTALVIVPLLMAAVLTAGLSVAMGFSVNFANIVVLPLLLGIGVDTGIHLVHRMDATSADETPLLASTSARSVLYSALTTMASFGTLSVSSHVGLASLGLLLLTGLGSVIVVNLVFLPAITTRRPGP